MKYNEKIQISQDILNQCLDEEDRTQNLYNGNGIFKGKYQTQIIGKYENEESYDSNEDLNDKLNVYDGTRRGEK